MFDILEKSLRKEKRKRKGLPYDNVETDQEIFLATYTPHHLHLRKKQREEREEDEGIIEAQHEVKKQKCSTSRSPSPSMMVIK